MSYIYCVKCALSSETTEHQSAFFIIDGISVCTKHFYEKSVVSGESFVVKEGKLEYKNIELGQKDD